MKGGEEIDNRNLIALARGEKCNFNVDHELRIIVVASRNRQLVIELQLAPASNAAGIASALPHRESTRHFRCVIISRAFRARHESMRELAPVTLRHSLSVCQRS